MRCCGAEVDREIGLKYFETKENILIRKRFLVAAAPRLDGAYNSPKSR